MARRVCIMQYDLLEKGGFSKAKPHYFVGGGWLHLVFYVKVIMQGWFQHVFLKTSKHW